LLNTSFNFKASVWFDSFMNFIFTDFIGLNNIIAIKSSECVLVCSSIAIVTMFLIVLFTERKWKYVILVLLTLVFLFWTLSAFRVKDPTIITMIKGNRYSYLPIIFASWALIIGIAKTNTIWIRSMALVMIGLVFLNSALTWQNQKSSRIKIKELANGRYYAKVPPSADWNFTFTDPRSPSTDDQ